MRIAAEQLVMRYGSTAAVLGVGWFVVLLIPRLTREWLLANPLQNLGFLVAASIIVAVACRGFILRADALGAHLVRATVMPYLGCLVFLSLTAAALWARSFLSGGLANLHDTVSLYVMGLTATTLSLFVVVPYGLLCQYVLNSISTSLHGDEEPADVLVDKTGGTARR
jgi:hypothetical protein